MPGAGTGSRSQGGQGGKADKAVATAELQRRNCNDGTATAWTGKGASGRKRGSAGRKVGGSGPGAKLYCCSCPRSTRDRSTVLPPGPRSGPLLGETTTPTALPRASRSTTIVEGSGVMICWYISDSMRLTFNPSDAFADRKVASTAAGEVPLPKPRCCDGKQPFPGRWCLWDGTATRPGSSGAE